jgi:hypothetical protein
MLTIHFEIFTLLKELVQVWHGDRHLGRQKSQKFYTANIFVNFKLKINQKSIVEFYLEHFEHSLQGNYEIFSILNIICT